MARRTSVTTSEREKQLHKRIRRWRSSRVKLWPMPGSLWAEAAALARELGVYRVSRALRLNYESLKRRVGKTSRGGGVAAARSGEFVELSGAQLLGLPAGPVVELTDGSGVRLTVRLASGSALDVMRDGLQVLDGRSGLDPPMQSSAYPDQGQVCSSAARRRLASISPIARSEATEQTSDPDTCHHSLLGR